MSLLSRFVRPVTATRDETIAAMQKRIDQLEARLRQVEAAPPAKPAIWFAGAWKPGTAYEVGAAVHHKGGLWLATSPAAADVQPGNFEAPDAQSRWRMVVRRPKDAKDLNPDLFRRQDKLYKRMECLETMMLAPKVRS